MNTATEPCSLCAQVEGKPQNNFIHQLLPTAWSRRPILAESFHSVVMPSVGGLSVGHILVCPKGHIRSVAAAEPYERTDLCELAERMAQHLQSHTQLPVHRFEHGSSSVVDGPIACSVEHAHIHLVPAAADIMAQLKTLGSWRAVAASDDVSDLTGGCEYLDYRAPGGKRFVACTTGSFRSQGMRQLLATALGIGQEWNWRLHPAIARMEATASLFTLAASRNTVAASC